MIWSSRKFLEVQQDVPEERGGCFSQSSVNLSLTLPPPSQLNVLR